MYFNKYLVVLIICQQFYLTIQYLNIIPIVLYYLNIPVNNFVNYDPVNYELEYLIKMSIDDTIDPCDDFYGYACNKYQQLNTDTNYDEVIGLIDYKLNKILINLMERNFREDFQISEQYQTIMEKTKIYYKSCIMERNKRNVTKYFDELKLGDGINWPILEEVKRDEISQDSTLYEWPDYIKFDFLDLLGELQSYGLQNVLINQEITKNEDNSYNIVIEPAFMGEDTDTTLPEENVLRALMMGLGLKNPSKLAKYIKQLQTTDKELNDIIQNYTQTDEAEEVIYQNLQLKYPNLKLMYFIKNLLPSIIDNHTLITIKNPQYFQYLNDKVWELSEKQLICNYLMLKFLYYLAKDSTPEFTPLDCIQDLRNKMDLSVNYIYYDYVYQYKAYANNYEIMDITDKIVNTTSDFFQENNLDLSEQQLEKLQEKLLNIKTNIGNLPANANLQKIEEFYKNVPDLVVNNYYKNHLLLLKHRFAKSINYLPNETFFITPDNRLGSSSAPVYIQQQNMIIIPFGSLQFPLFHYNYHPLFKWSSMGFILAHEFTHAFDTTGLNYDSKGLPLPSDSDILDNENFNSTLECMQSQQPTESIDERIADLFAIRIVYRIYEDYFDLQPPFLHLHWKKTFFLSLAQFFCGKENIEFIDHDADSIRLQQIAMNFEEFSEAFHCPEGSKMNPKDKCRLY